MTNIKKGYDGTCRWAYEFDMLRNPIILLTVLKIFFCIIIAMWVLFGALHIGDMGFIGAYTAQAKELLLPALILFVLSLAGYAVLASLYGWKYCVLFEMNEDGIRHIQMEKQVKIAQALGWLTAMTGAAAGNPGTTGTGILASSRNELYTEFSKVKKMRVYKSLHTIKLNAPFNHNQVYVQPEDFPFVLDFISQRVKQED